jgi:hypothetical protein
MSDESQYDSESLSSGSSSADDEASWDEDYHPNSEEGEYEEEQHEIERAREMGGLRDTLELLKAYFEKQDPKREHTLEYLARVECGAESLDKYFSQYPEYGF